MLKKDIIDFVIQTGSIKTVASIFAQTLDISPKNYNKNTKTFSLEMSQTNLPGAPHILNVRNPKTKAVVEFKRTKIDWADGTHEDIGGYWYESQDGLKLLLIND